MKLPLSFIFFNLSVGRGRCKISKEFRNFYEYRLNRFSSFAGKSVLVIDRMSIAAPPFFIFLFLQS